MTFLAAMSRFTLFRNVAINSSRGRSFDRRKSIGICGPLVKGHARQGERRDIMMTAVAGLEIANVDRIGRPHAEDRSVSRTNRLG